MTLKRFTARNGEQIFELRIPGFDAIFQIDREYAYVQRFDDVLTEILQPLDLHGLLLERLIEPRILNGDGNVTRDGGKQFEIVRREIIAIDRFAEAQNRDGAVAEATGNEIIQIELFERAAHGVRFLACRPRRFEEQTPALQSRTRRVQKR